MRVRAKVSNVYDGRNSFYTMDDEFEVDEERGNFLLSLNAVERLDAPESAPAKRGPGRPKKTDS